MLTWDKRHEAMLWAFMERVEVIFREWISVALAVFMIQLGE